MRTHPKVLFVPAVFALAGTAGVGFASALLPAGMWQFIAWGAWAFVYLVLCGPKLHRWATTTYTVGTQEVTVSSGLVSTKRRSMRLDRIVSIDVERGLLDRIFGCGTLRLSDASNDAVSFVLDDVPHVEDVQRRLRTGSSHSV